MLKLARSKPKGYVRFAFVLAIVLACICGASSAAFADETPGETPADPPAETAAEPQPENGIPLVIVRVDETNVTIDQMNESYDHSVRCEAGTVEIKLPEGYVAPEGYNATVPESPMTLKYVRGRGNSTWSHSKKPYKVELKAAADLFGMGASTDWALLANYFDKSLMRNRISFWLGDKMGLAFTPQQVPVDLVMIGSKTGEHWYGSYCLCETIKVEESRINIGKLKKKDTENITGGYILATYSDQDGGEDPTTWFTTNYGVEIYNDSPDYEYSDGAPLTEAQIAQRDYIRGYVQEVEDLVMNAEMEDGKITEEAHKLIDEKMDLKSAADFWLLQEVPFNTDGYATTSTYMYKARDGKLYWGPMWDFDYAWWNNPAPWPESNNHFNNTSMLWIDHLRAYDPAFGKLLKERWQVLNEQLQEVTKEGGLIDQYKAEVSKSQQADYEVWKDQTGDYQGTSAEDFGKELEAMKSWIETRRNWADTNKSELDHVYCTAVYMVKGKVVATEDVRYGGTPVMNPDVKAPEGYVLEAWMNGKKTADKTELTEDTIFNAKFVEESKATAPTELAIYLPDLVDGKVAVDLSQGFFPAVNREGLTLDYISSVEPYGSVTNPRITWTSSDENVAAIDPVNHRVILKAGGDTTITGTLYNGVTSSFVLHVKAPEPEPQPDPEPTPEPISIEGAKVVLSAASYTYNGKAKKPAVKTIAGKSLTAGTDYTVTIKNSKGVAVASPKAAGTYTLYVTGTGNYTGTASAAYKINKAANSLKINGKTAKIKQKKLQKKAQKVTSAKAYKVSKSIKDKKTYTLVSAKKGSKSFKKYFKVNKSTGNILIKKNKKMKKGTYKVKVNVKALGTSNYKASAAKTVTIKVKVK